MSDSNMGCSMLLIILVDYFSSSIEYKRDMFHAESCARVTRFCLEGLIKLSRTKKLLIALHDKDSLLKYLANVPMQLMPEVLEFVQLEEDLRKRMSMMYCLMRWWNMPALYSFIRTCFLSTKKRKGEGIVYRKRKGEGIVN